MHKQADCVTRRTREIEFASFVDGKHSENSGIGLLKISEIFATVGDFFEGVVPADKMNIHVPCKPCYYHG